MEALVAVGVASNVVQLVDFGARVTKRCIDIYNSSTGLSKDLISIQDITSDLNSLSAKLSASLRTDIPIGPLSEDDQKLYNVASKCKASTERLLTVLEKINKHKSRGVVISIYKGFKVELFHKRDIEKISDEMTSYREELSARVLVDLKAKLDFTSIQQTSAFSKLDRDIQAFVESLAQDRQVFMQQQATLEDLHQRMQVHCSTEHEKTRALIRQIAEEINSMQIQPKIQGINYDDEKVQRRLRESLYFPEHIKRQEEVAEAHKDTFRWIFKQDHFSGFAEWLQKGSRIYYINGKAGSGKSTLMNLIWEEQQLRSFLLQWTEGCPYVCARFFFSQQGSELQQSLAGLLRSLIFQILEQQPSLSEKCFPDKNEAYRILDSQIGFDSIQWTEKRLKPMLKRLLEQLSTSVKVFFLIDGLDENNEDEHDMLVNLISDITQNNYIKACVSSRQLGIFEDAFTESKQLRLQDLTSKDIAAYVHDSLESNQLFKEAKSRQELEKIYLIQEITENSCGIFLWTKLVVSFVLDSLRSYHTLSAIRQEVHSLPRELDTLYEKMLKDIEKNQLDFINFSKLCQIIIAYKKNTYQVSLCQKTFLSPLDVVFVFSEDQSTSIAAPARSKPRMLLTRQIEVAKLRLFRQSRGFLEVVECMWNPSIPMAWDSLVGWNVSISDNYINANNGGVEAKECELRWDKSMTERVQFFHNSVSDFLCKPQVWQRLCHATSESGFSGHEALLESTLMQLKSCIFRMGDLSILIEQAFASAIDVERATNRPCQEALDELDRILQRFISGTRAGAKFEAFQHWSRHSQLGIRYESKRLKAHGNFLAYATWQGAIKYVTEKISSSCCESLCTESGCPLLHFCFDRQPLRFRLYGVGAQGTEGIDHYKAVKALLDLGADPNYEFEGFTAWDLLLHQAFEISPCYDFGGEIFLELALLMLQHNVNLNSTVRRLYYQTELNTDQVEFSAFWLFDSLFDEASLEYAPLRRQFLEAGSKREVKLRVESCWEPSTCDLKTIWVNAETNLRGRIPSD